MKMIIFIILFSIFSFRINAATDEGACAALVVAQIKIQNPEATDAFLIPYWTAICKGILDHLKASADVLPGTFKDSTSTPITGIGKIQ